MMWIVLILSLAAMSALTVIQTPREWLKHKLLRILLLIYHTVGITSIALILFAVYRTVCMSRIFRVVVPVSVQNVSVIGVARFIISFPSLSAYFIAVYAPPLCFSTQHRRSCACSTIHSFRFLIAAFGWTWWSVGGIITLRKRKYNNQSGFCLP